ncbi:MAG: O-antigen ligase family protein, partial [Bacteroidetes bacterium]|nr:O-antigen ligase family protein [Bacteroidota bacterium]
MKKISFQLYLLLLIFTPLAFGSSELWAKLIMVVLICLSSCFYYFSKLSNSKKLIRVPGLLPLLLLLGWMILQIIPLPVNVVKLISPNTYEVYRPILDIGNNASWITLSVNVKNSLLELIRISGYVLFYVMTIQLLKESKYLQKIIWTMVYCGSAIAFIAIFQKLITPDAIFGLRAAPETTFPIGPWVNRNQYAGFVAMILPFVIALFLYYQPVVNEKDSLRIKIVKFLSMALSGRQAFLGLSMIILIFSVILSLSRGGVIAIVVSLLSFFILISFKKNRNIKWSALVVIICIIFGGLWAGLDQLLVRFDNIVHEFSGTGGAGRIHVWQDSLEIIRDFFLTGTGFGTFVS